MGFGSCSWRFLGFGAADECSVLRSFAMTSSEVSVKGNCSNGRGESFSSGCSEPNDGGNAMKGVSASLASGKGESSTFCSIFFFSLSRVSRLRFLVRLRAKLIFF